MDYSSFIPEPHTPAPRIVFWLVVIALAGGMWFILSSNGRIGQSDALSETCATSYIPTGARMITKDDAERTVTFGWTDIEEVRVTLPFEPDRAYEGCSPSAKRTLASAYKQSSDQLNNEPSTLRRHADRSEPIAKDCPISEGTIVTVHVSAKKQLGKCVALNGDQQLVIMNDGAYVERIILSTKQLIPGVPININIPPHASSTIPFSVKEFLRPGVHDIFGDPAVMPEVMVLPY